MYSALIVVDEQNDFVEGGSLPVTGGNEVVRKTVEYMKDDIRHSLKIATADWHPAEGTADGHFKEWPVHCVAGTYGATFAPPLASWKVDYVFHKGQDAAAYSGFQGHNAQLDMDLDTFLRSRNVTKVTIVGLAADYCVLQTVLDAIYWGYEVEVIADLTAAVGDKATALDKMAAAGAKII